MAGRRTKSGEVTLAHVAAHAGVSAITASRVFRNPDIVSDAVRVRVEEAVRTLNYVPNMAARALASRRTDVIGVIIPSVTNNVFADVLRGIYDTSQGGSHIIQLGNTRYGLAEEERLLRIFQSQKPAGLIVAGVDQTDDARAMLEAMNCPVVQIMEIGPQPVDMMVGFSHRDAASAVTGHLVEQGYRRIGFVGARMDPRTQRRFEGFREALQARDLFDPGRVVTTVAASTVPLGGQLLSDLVAKAPDTDAVFCINDDLALGVLFECQRRHIEVPRQMGIAGFNDMDVMAAAVPTLTSVRTHRYEMGRQAIAMVEAAIAGNRPKEPVVDLGFELMARQSTAGKAIRQR